MIMSGTSGTRAAVAHSPAPRAPQRATRPCRGSNRAQPRLRCALGRSLSRVNTPPRCGFAPAFYGAGESGRRCASFPLNIHGLGVRVRASASFLPPLPGAVLRSFRVSKSSALAYRRPAESALTWGDRSLSREQIDACDKGSACVFAPNSLRVIR